MTGTPIHVGRVLKDELDYLNISAAEFARLLHVPANRISQILNGKRSLTADTAMRLGKFFGNGPGIWMRLQMRYELDLIEKEIEPELKFIPALSQTSYADVT